MGRFAPVSKTILARQCARRRGFLLLDGMIASVILALLVLGVCEMLSAAYLQTDILNTNASSNLLVRQLTEEIFSKPMADPSTGSTALGPDAGMSSRSAYTRITNYNGYSDVSTALPSEAGGTVDATGAASFARSVAVTVGARPSIDSSTSATQFAIVAVTITAPNGQKFVVNEFAANYPIQR